MFFKLVNIFCFVFYEISNVLSMPDSFSMWFVTSQNVIQMVYSQSILIHNINLCSRDNSSMFLFRISLTILKIV